MKNRFGEIFLSYGVNYFRADKPLQEMLRQFNFQGDADMESLGSFVSSDMIEAVDFIDHRSPPFLQTWSLLGKRIDMVRISPEHRRLLTRLQEFGVTRKSVSGEAPWLYHFVSGYLISDAGLFCSLTLTAQTGYGLKKYGTEEMKAKFLPRFTTMEDPWLGATYYSEIQGGSDVGANRTTADRSGSDWVLNGQDKYFASNAGLADAALITAKPTPPKPGPKGISLFFVPAFHAGSGEPTYAIRRLKNKLGTIAVPTGEVELEKTPGYLLGDTDHGIYIALEILGISRLDNAFASVGIARKALWEAYRYAQKREAFGKRLLAHPLLARDVIEMEADVEAGLLISLHAAQAFEKSLGDAPPYTADYHYARLLAHVAKYMTAILAREVTGYAMEMLGGIGFFEEFQMAKLHRDAMVTPIWEGTGNIQALDALEVMAKKTAHDRLLGELKALLEATTSDEEMKHDLTHMMERFRVQLDEILSFGERSQFYAKDVIGDLGELASAIYLLAFADRVKRDSGEEWALSMARIYFHRHIARESTPVELLKEVVGGLGWMA